MSTERALAPAREPVGRRFVGTPAARLMARTVVTDSGCWVWTGARNQNGYGAIYAGNRRMRPAHRVAYEAAKGPIPDGLVIDHLCRNPLCVNPDHLEAVTEQVNIARGESPSAVTARTGVCQRGHLQSRENVYVTPQGGRQCRVCRRLRHAAFREARRAQRRAA